MTPIEMIDSRRGARVHEFLGKPDWHSESSRSTYECRALLYLESVGGYSAIAKRLPGVASQGETEEEALANLKEAFAGAVAMYLEDSVEIPWTDEGLHIEQTDTAKERWILVDV